MSQVTNLNVFPYFDDFDPENNYHRVLFKPGYPVQARELTTLQSMLQNQIERFGQHFFKEGAKVIPGNTAYNQTYYAIELNNTYAGAPIDAYIDQLIGVKIVGESSGVTAVVDSVITSDQSERGNATLYVNYLGSSLQNNSTQQFSDGETLLTSSTILTGLLGGTAIPEGAGFAITIANDAASTGSSFSISNGVYFIRGQFVNVRDETLVLDQYSNTPSYRIGLFVNEEIITSDLDESLNDNSTGFNNYASPGADRLRISTSLFKKSLTDFNDENFVELAVVENGILRSQKQSSNLNYLSDELARRTYAESGDYYVKPFELTVLESLNDGVGNGGVYEEGQLTQTGSVPSDDLALYKISPGRAFVRGYDVETISSNFLDCPKTRTTKLVEGQSISYNTGSTFKLNRVYGSPTIGIGNTYVLSLRDSRVGSSSISEPGKEIGLARVYDFKLNSGSYNTSNTSLNEWSISLYDIQTTTEITLNEPVTLSTPTFIRGKYSGATAFLKESVSNSASLVVYEKSGDFSRNEPFFFDGIENSRVATAITSYGISDAKSVYGVVGSGSTFTADIIQRDLSVIGFATVSASTGGISTITSTNPLFPGTSLKTGDILKYSSPDFQDPVLVQIVDVGDITVSVSVATTVVGINAGELPSSILQVNDLRVLATKLEFATNNTLFTALPKKNVSNVSLTDSSITIRKTYTVNISAGQLSSAITADTNEAFLPFTADRYTLIRSDGTYEVLTSDKVLISNASKELQIYNLGTNNTGATLVVTVQKLKPKAKKKYRNRVNSVIVNKSKFNYSGIGSTTVNDGLSFGSYAYGTRVHDDRISLNTSDVLEVHAVYESSNPQAASAPTAILASISGPTNKTADLVIGERLVGQNSGAVAIVAEKLTDTQISFIPKNKIDFREGEVLRFEESNITATIVTLNSPSFNITENFSFNPNQKGTFSDYGSIVRGSTIKAPSKQLKIYFSNGYYESSDDGDITTVNSYENFNRLTEIKSVEGNYLADIIDIRPKTSIYTVAEGSRSPFEFYGRIFNQSGNSAANILASNETILLNYSYFLPRVDRIYLTKDGKFLVKYGTPSEKLEKPDTVDDAIEIATITIPPYVYSLSNISIEALDYKRYRMVDIKKLEDRIKNLEYYTALSLLETNTENLFVPDSQGLNRFKSGFFVDNFTSLSTQDTTEIGAFKNSLDVRNKELRPRHYTTSIDLSLGPVEGVDPTTDRSTLPIEGTNVRKSTDVITLDYAEVEWLKQSFATRAESVTPFLISFWQGTLELTPASDTWVDQVRLEAKKINAEGNFAETMANAVTQFGVDPQTGFAPVVWNAWEDNWTGRDVITNSRQRTIVSGGQWQGNGPGGTARPRWDTRTSTVVREDLRETIDTGTATRTGSRVIVTEQFDESSLGDRTVSRDVIPYMRSRNIQFINKKLKPLTQFYGFFDGVDVTKYCVPKLLEISMVSGTFQVGEKIVGIMPLTGLGPSSPKTSPSITFRAAQINHKEGPYNIPTKVYTQNPYNSQVLSSSYSSTSTVLNIDTFSLADQPEGDYFGWVAQNMVLTGQTSGAQATITNVRLVSDLSATLIGSFYIPDPNVITNPKFEVGTKVLSFVNNDQNDQNTATSISEEGYTASGTLETIQENILSVRNARVQNKQEFEERAISRTTGVQVVGSTVLAQDRRQVVVGWYDPLAQSFLVDEDTGIFITRCDIFFRSKDDMDIPVTLQLRTMQNGYPTQKILPFAEVTLDPNEVNISADGSVPTSFVFQSPVYVEGGDTEYAICVASNSTKYSVYVSRVGENDIINQTFISNQPYLGSLFKSQNASTWEASQWEDLKFVLYRADFIDSGDVQLYNPILSSGNGQVPTLTPDPIDTESRRIRVSLSSSLTDPDLTFGNTVLQQGINAYGNYVDNAGIATGTLNVINAGLGYTPSASFATYNNVLLTTITGNGRNATANVSVQNGVAVAATITSSGNGYVIGDVVGVTTLGSIPVGSGARFSIVSIASTSEIILDNVQGDFIVGVANTLQFVNNSGLTTEMNYSTGGGLQISDINVETDGLHIVVNHQNHGMYFEDNYVTISNVLSDVRPTKLTSSYSATSTDPIPVESISGLELFENVGVASTNPGYVLIGDEIIEYTATASGLISGTISRGSTPKDYPIGTPVYKYELSGVSLSRINKTHYLADATVSDPISFDSYTLKIDTSTDGIDRSTGASYPKLYVYDTKSTGGENVTATQNIPYEIITPLVQNMTVQGTSVSAEVRTVTGQSASGSEVPFTDNGYESITINKPNYLDTTRLVCSRINETSQLTNLPGNRSLNMRLLLESTDTRLSPVIDSQRMSVILTSNRVNAPITDYITDSRVNSALDDPNAFQYVSKEIRLENSASSLKILLSAYITEYSDIRAFYALGESDNFTPIFVPFPGWDNLNDNGQIINPANNSGRSDAIVEKSTIISPDYVDHREYTFTADNLPAFRNYRIKLIMTSTSQVYAPRVRDLRVIALA